MLISIMPIHHKKRVWRQLMKKVFLMLSPSSIRYKKIKAINQNFCHQKVVLNNNQCLSTPCLLLKITKTRFKQVNSPSIIRVSIDLNTNSILSSRCKITTKMRVMIMKLWVESCTIWLRASLSPH